MVAATIAPEDLSILDKRRECRVKGRLRECERDGGVNSCVVEIILNGRLQQGFYVIHGFDGFHGYFGWLWVALSGFGLLTVTQGLPGRVLKGLQDNGPQDYGDGFFEFFCWPLVASLGLSSLIFLPCF